MNYLISANYNLIKFLYPKHILTSGKCKIIGGNFEFEPKYLSLEIIVTNNSTSIINIFKYDLIDFISSNLTSMNIGDIEGGVLTRKSINHIEMKLFYGINNSESIKVILNNKEIFSKFSSNIKLDFFSINIPIYTGLERLLRFELDYESAFTNTTVNQYQTQLNNSNKTESIFLIDFFTINDKKIITFDKEMLLDIPKENFFFKINPHITDNFNIKNINILFRIY